jgi:hypothetical protein
MQNTNNGAATGKESMNPFSTKQSLRWLILAALFFSVSAASFGQLAVGISVRFGPPPLPIYTQPVCPGAGYIWTPGYWAWDDVDGYYWVPGTWVLAPVAMLWTPGYWGWSDGLYVWNAGYWGPTVGFYGGINYGFGYTGVGFYGGEWRGGTFFYNRAVTNINVTNVTNVYSRNVVVNNNHVSYNGGRGGLTARPTTTQLSYAREHHTGPVAAQLEQQRVARQNHSSFASVNHGRPAVAATSRAGEFTGAHIVAARAAGGKYHAPTMSPREAHGPSNRGSENRATETRENTQKVSPRENARPVARENAPKAPPENNTHARQQEQRQQKPEQQQARQQEKSRQKAEQQQAKQQEQRQQKAEQQQVKQQEQRQQKAQQSQARQQEKSQRKAEQQQARQEKTQRSEHQQPKAEAPARAHKQEPKAEGRGPGL